MTTKGNSHGRSCQICGNHQHSELHPAVLVRPALAALIRERHRDWSEDGWICHDDLQHFRNEYVRSLLATEQGEVSALATEVADSLRHQEILSRDPDEAPEPATFGQRLADRIATFGGSWRFILIFLAVLIGWITLNAAALLGKPFDPFPFILLNLILSCVAAIQAPVIMMSQNRQEERDRQTARRDYQVNLKAELEIRHLHQKLDHLLSHQWERLVAIQEVQMELMEELRKRR